MEKGGVYASENVNGLSILRFTKLSERVRHGFTTRRGGVSVAPYDSLNLSLSRPDARSNVQENYRLLCAAEDLDEESLTIVNYAHGDDVLVVGSNDAGRGWKREPLASCDAIITNAIDVTLVTLHADCLCLFLYDPVKHAAGLVHAGWKGCSLELGAKTFLRMTEVFGCSREDIFCGIGPGICAGCFEVDAPVAYEFYLHYPQAVSSDETIGKYHVDLPLVLRTQLINAGARNIEDMALCTFCKPDLFFSHRRDAGKTGAMAAYIKLL